MLPTGSVDSSSLGNTWLHSAHALQAVTTGFWTVWGELLGKALSTHDTIVCQSDCTKI